MEKGREGERMKIICKNGALLQTFQKLKTLGRNIIKIKCQQTKPDNLGEIHRLLENIS